VYVVVFNEERPMTDRYIGRLWKHLEFEEQATVRRLMREGKVKIEGTGATRRVVVAPLPDPALAGTLTAGDDERFPTEEEYGT
jgi:hypothetical protein